MYNILKYMKNISDESHRITHIFYSLEANKNILNIRNYNLNPFSRNYLFILFKNKKNVITPPHTIDSPHLIMKI